MTLGDGLSEVGDVMVGVISLGAPPEGVGVNDDKGVENAVDCGEVTKEQRGVFEGTTTPN